MRGNILQSNINSILAAVFVGTFTFAALLIIVHTAFGHDPVEDAFTAAIISSSAMGDGQ